MLGSVEVSELIEAEQKWIDSTGCAFEYIGFNVHTLARSSLGVKRRSESKMKLSITRSQTWEGFIDPEGHLRCGVKHISYIVDGGLHADSAGRYQHQLALGFAK